MKQLIAIALSSTLIACASSDPEYVKASGDEDYGYSETQITDNRYRVNYNGNRSTTSNEVKDMALLRAAELTKLNDYDWFRVMSRDTEENSSNRAAVSTGLSRGTQVSRSCGLLGCTTTTSPSYSAIEITTVPGRDMYSTSIEIVMGAGEVEDTTSVYNASELYAFLENKY